MIRIVNGNSTEWMQKFRSNTFDLIFADPPYNIGYEYDVHKDNMTYAQYLSFTNKWVYQCTRLLRKGGSLFVLIGDEYAAEMKNTLDFLGMTMRNWIIWRYGFGQNCAKKFARCHAHLLYFVKGEKDFTFNAPEILIPSDRQTKYNDKRAIAGGKIPEDVWDIPRLCGTHKERTLHPCQLPEALVERVVRVASNPGGLVLDPFCGSGTTAVVCKRLNCSCWTADVSQAYVDAARQRVAAVVPNL